MSVASKVLPAAGTFFVCGWITWKSWDTSRGGKPAIAGQLPVPLSSRVQVTGSPTPAFSGTTLEASLKVPTAPVKFGGGAGSGRTVIAGAELGTENCSYWRCWKNPKPVTPTLRFTSCLAAFSCTRPGLGAIARVW